MPRNNVPGSTLRNRNRITNKSRLRIVIGNFDTDIVVPDDEDDKNRLLQQTAGVDAEDANEHHLQAVLSAAAQRHNRKPGPEKDIKKPPAPAYIPTPQAQGVADDWQSLYPQNVWKDPVSFVCSSTTADEAITSSLAGEFTYYMDERDKDWLDRNNEEARGEGTSALGALSPGATRSSSRSAKAKGKDPEASQPVVISEDDFELVMGLFEKITHEKTEFLHHSFDSDTFPPFSDYHDTFANELPPTTFANFVKPDWVPKPQILVRIAQIIYPYWKERRVERQGHRIIPTLNFDESDTLNESYICFRRREIKSVRKTRASQVTTSDKLARLQAEMAYPLKLAQLVVEREKTKAELSKEAQRVWETRLAFVDFRRKFPSLVGTVDEELLIDKERPPKKVDPSRQPNGIKLKSSRDDSVAPGRQEVIEKPRDRLAKIQSKIDHALAAQKDRNAHWEDPENIYQPRPAPYHQRLFRYYEPPSSAEYEQQAAKRREPIGIRTRRGRGGRFLVDRRHLSAQPALDNCSRSKLFDLESLSSDHSDASENGIDRLKVEREERRQRVLSQWKFDQDDTPAVPPAGTDEQDRVLVDEYDPKYVRYSITWLGDADQSMLTTDTNIHSICPAGRPVTTTTYRPVQPSISLVRRDPVVRVYQQPQVQISQVGQANGAMGSPLKKQVMPGNIARMAGVRSISTLAQQQSSHMMVSAVGDQSSSPNAVQATSATQTSPPPKPAPTPVNGATRSPMNVPLPQPEASKPESTPAIHNGSTENVPPTTQPMQPNGVVQNGSPPHPKPQSHPTLPNGFHPNGYPPSAMPTSPPMAPNGMGPHNIRATGLSQTQLQTLKSAFAANPSQDPGNRPFPPGYMHMLPTGGFQMTANHNVKLPQARQLQWATTPGLAQANGNTNGVDANGIPARTPSAGTRRVTSNGQVAPHGIPNPRPQSTSPIPSLTQSPPRPPTTPTIQPQPTAPPGQNGF